MESFSGFAGFLMRGGSADGLGLFYWRTFNLHPLVRAALFRDWLDPHGTSYFGRFIDCVDYSDICQSFVARWFGRPVMNNAIGEINEFWRKLIAWFEGLLRLFFTNHRHAFQFPLILISILQPKVALCANKIVMADVGGAEAARERR